MKSNSVKRRVEKYRCLSAGLLLMTFLSGCSGENENKDVDVASVILNKTGISLVKGGEATLTATVFPSDATVATVKWTSDNNKVATVTEGKVKGVAVGNAIITAKAGEQTAICTVTVKPALIGVYYFDGWAGRNSHADDPNEPWAANAPTHLTRRMIEEFPGREPIWGWRDDSQAVMEQQIDLAADNGVDFFLYCWYWHNDRSYINAANIENDSKHTGIQLHLTAKNKAKLRYCLLATNHEGAEIVGGDNWADAVKYWAKNYFNDSQYVTVDGKPLLFILNPGDSHISSEDIAKMQETAQQEGFKDGLAIAGCGFDARGKEGIR
jgi:hypothetical protein